MVTIPATESSFRYLRDSSFDSPCQPVTSLNNIIKCANRAGLEVNGIALQSLAAGEAVLTDEEKELGASGRRA